MDYLFGKDTDKRTFLRVDQSGMVLGQFTGSTPGQAARKAVTEARRRNKKSRKVQKIDGQRTIMLRETGSDKVRKYVGKVTKLSKPVVLELGGKKVTKKYKTSIKSKGVVSPVQRGGNHHD